MHTTANIKVNETVSPVETGLMGLIRKHMQDGEITIMLPPTSAQDSSIIVPVSPDDKPAGWLRNNPIPGL